MSYIRISGKLSFVYFSGKVTLKASANKPIIQHSSLILDVGDVGTIYAIPFQMLDIGWNAWSCLKHYIKHTTSNICFSHACIQHLTSCISSIKSFFQIFKCFVKCFCHEIFMNFWNIVSKCCIERTNEVLCCATYLNNVGCWIGLLQPSGELLSNRNVYRKHPWDIFYHVIKSSQWKHSIKTKHSNCN